MWQKIKNNPNFQKKYISITAIVLILIIVSSLCFLYGNSITNKNILSYDEKGKIDYKVYLKENGFYAEKYLTGSNRKYIAALIDNIELDFNYNMNYEKNVSCKYDYYIDATLNIAQPDDKQKIYYTDTQRLVDTTKKEVNGDKFSINEKLDIDYDKYGDMVKAFSSAYSLSPACFVKIDFVLNVSGSYDENIRDISKTSTMSIEIPFYEKSISMGTDGSSISNEGTYLEKEKYEQKRRTWSIIAWTLLASALLLATYLMILIVKVMNKKLTKYEKTVRKIFKKYDQIIIMAYGDVKILTEKTVEVGKFEELVDVSELINQPIKCYTSDEGIVFVLSNAGNETYTFEVKRDPQEGIQDKEEAADLQEKSMQDREEPTDLQEESIQDKEEATDLQEKSMQDKEESAETKKEPDDSDMTEVAGVYDEISKLGEALIEELDNRIEENLSNAGESDIRDEKK